MKTLGCDICGYEASGETFEEWMEALRPHYAEAHADFMSDTAHTEDDMRQWMTENRARFDSAS